MRFEAKYAYFKDIVRGLKNCKNLPLTFAKRHQQMECADMLTVDEDDPCSLFKDDFCLGNSRSLTGSRQEDEIDLTEFAMFKAKSVVVHGTKYVCGDNNYLLLGLLRLIKAWVKNDFRLQCPPRRVRGIGVECAGNHSYSESRLRIS